MTQTPGDERKIGHYELRGKLGEGGMGIVWRAHDPLLERDVAIKLLRMPEPRNDELYARFLREARSAAKLNHPHTVIVHQIAEFESQICIVMELVDGGSLADQVKEMGPLSWGEATAAIRDAAKGLQAAHEAGIIHRDIKPSNLMRTAKGVIKLVDFGLAKPQGQRDDLELTLPGTVLGSPAYMSPEQCEGAEADARSDLYSLICTYYQLLSGYPPFSGSNISVVIHQHVSEAFPDVRRHVPDIPDAVVRVIQTGSRKDPQARYQTAAELITALEAVLEPNKPARAADEPASSGAAPVDDASASGNLPSAATLIGREAMLEDLRGHTARRGIVALTGQAGAGKTALALSAAHAAVSSGVARAAAWLSCAAKPSREECVRALAGTLLGDRRESDPIEQCQAAVIEQVRSQHAAVVIDDLDLVGQDAAVVQTVRGLGNAGLVILTARTVSVAMHATAIRVDALPAERAIEMLHQRVADAAGEPLAPGDAEALAGFARGWPLAVELLAARVARSPGQEVLTHLRAGAASAGEATRTVLGDSAVPIRACFAVCFEYLSPKARNLLLNFAVMPSEFDGELIAAVRGSGDWTEAADELVGAAFWRVDAEVPGRYGAHPLVRQIAIEELGPARPVVEANLAKAILARVASIDISPADGTVEVNLREGRHEQVAWLDSQWDALGWAVDRADSEPLRAMLPPLAPVIEAFSRSRGRWSDCRRIGQAIGAACRSNRDRAGELAAERLLGAVFSGQGQAEEARKAYERMAAVAKSMRDPRAEAAAHQSLGDVLRGESHYDEAARAYRQALLGYRQAGDTAAECAALHRLSTVVLSRGDQGELLLQAQTMMTRVRDPKAQYSLCVEHGQTCESLNRVEQATGAFEQAVTLARRVGDRQAEQAAEQTLTRMRQPAPEPAPAVVTPPPPAPPAAASSASSSDIDSPVAGSPAATPNSGPANHASCAATPSSPASGSPVAGSPAAAPNIAPANQATPATTANSAPGNQPTPATTPSSAPGNQASPAAAAAIPRPPTQPPTDPGALRADELEMSGPVDPVSSDPEQTLAPPKS